MANINRDYMVIIDVKSGSVNKPTMVFYNTDKNTSNIYAQLVVKETIVTATPIENATDYSVELKVVKPGNIVKFMDGVLVNEEQAIYEFDLPEDFTNLSGNYDIEFWVKAKVNDRDEMITSSKAKYTVKPSILTDLDEAIEDHNDYPLFLKLMEEVRVINETAHELDTTIRTLQSDMIHANNEMKANEEQRQANETTRVANEEARVEAERTRVNQEATRVEAETTREGQEATRVTNENDRVYKEDRRESQERDRVSNEYDRQNAEQSRGYAEMDRVDNEEIRQTNEANREAAEEIRKANEEARITAENARVTEHEQMRTELNEVKAENAILMENDKKVADRMTQVEISDKRQYVIMEGLMNSAGDGYLKIEDTGNDTTLYNSVEGFVDVKNITGNTMVNSIKNSDDELTLNADINTSGQSVTLTTAVDNGQVDVLAEGNTMVNVCDQQEAVAITKSYTVETGNHVALQGEYDGKARPVPTGNTLVNLMTAYKDESLLEYFTPANDPDVANISMLKPNTEYTLIFKAKYQKEGDSGRVIILMSEDLSKGISSPSDLTTTYQQYVFKFTTLSTVNNFVLRTNGSYFYIKDCILLEGDYTNKPIPDYFTGMQSSFEDKLVTQEMVDSGKELAENLGKYRVDYKVTGKNKFDGEWERGSINTNTGIKYDNDLRVRSKNYNAISSNTNISVSGDLTLNNSNAILYYDKNYNYLGRVNFNNLSSTPTFSNAKYFKLLMFEEDNTEISLSRNIQIEEGSTATAYEPYKESIKTYYLNSPLLEGDTIEESGGNVYHVHRSKQEIFNGDETFTKHLNETNNTLMFTCVRNNAYDDKNAEYCYSDKFISKRVYNEDNEGFYSGSDLICFRILKSKLPSEDVNGFKAWLQADPVTAVYKLASPQYELISQSDTILTDSYVAGHLDVDTVVPIKKVKFIRKDLFAKYLYPSTSYTIQFEADNNGLLDYIGINDDFIYSKTVNKGINKFTITTSPTIINTSLIVGGIGFSASNIVVTEATDKDFGYFSGMKSVGELEENTIEIVSANGTDLIAEGYLSNSKQIILNEPLRSVGDTKDRFVQIDGKWYVERNCAERNYETDDETNTSYKTDKVKTVYTLPSPTYEPVEISPVLNTYTDVTHITNNSTIPMNMPIVNSGYEVIAKPNTKYTVVGIDSGRIGDSTIVNGTITTPATITDNFLRPYGTGTTSKVMLLEGEPANIPSYFKGIKSVFEDKVTEDGKYACEVKVVGKNKWNNTYLDNAYISNGILTTITGAKVIIFEPKSKNTNYTISSTTNFDRNLIGYSNKKLDLYKAFEKVEDNGIVNNNNITFNSYDYKYVYLYVYRNQSNIPIIQIEEGTVATEYEPYHETKQTLYLDEPLYNTNNITIYNDKLGYWKNWDKVVLDGSDDERWDKSSQDYDSNINITFSIPQNNMSISWTNPEYIMNSSLPFSNNNIWKGQQEGVVTDSKKLMVCLNRAKLLTQDVAGFKQYLSQNPVTVVYQLNKPVFIPLIDNCPNWVIGSWDNCSIHFDSIIPLKDTRYRYTGNVPSVMTMSEDVATTKSISDEQDAMIVDLATDVAVMEMMLM